MTIQSERKLPRALLLYELGKSGYYEGVERVLSHLLSNWTKESLSNDAASLMPWLACHMPLIGHSDLKSTPGYLSLFLLAPFQPSNFRFFAQMCRSILPGRKLNLFLQFATDFVLPDVSNELYIAGEVVIRLENERQRDLFFHRYPLFESEVRLGLKSCTHANRLLEVKGLTGHEKRSLLHEALAELIEQKSDRFDHVLYDEMQRFFVAASMRFIDERSFLHLRRLLATVYLFRKDLQLAQEGYPNKREIYVKIIRAKGVAGYVLGLVVGLNHIKEQEMIQEKHLVQAVQSVLTDCHAVIGSFIDFNSSSEGSIRLFYVELSRQSTFRAEEIRALQSHLASALKQRIERRVNPLFMPENEEVVLRHFITLGNQIRHIRDLPHAILEFQLQTDEELQFLVIIARAASVGAPSLASLFSKQDALARFFHKKTNKTAFRKNYSKEVAIFTATLPKDLFLRPDRAIDLYKAREALASTLKEQLLDFRDYNGGMISKEGELFTQVQKKLGEIGQTKAFLLENFFYSIQPTVMRSVLPVNPLCMLFTMLVEMNQRTLAPYQYRVERCENCFLLVLVAEKESMCRAATDRISALKLPKFGLAFFDFVANDPCMGIIARHLTANQETEIERALQSALVL